MNAHVVSGKPKLEMLAPEAGVPRARVHLAFVVDVEAEPQPSDHGETDPEKVAAATEALAKARREWRGSLVACAAEALAAHLGVASEDVDTDDGGEPAAE